MRRVSIAVWALLVVPAATADPGGDAPADPNLAQLLAAGSYTGQLGPGDDTDVYLVQHAAGLAVRVTAAIDEGALSMSLYDAQFNPVDDAVLQSDFEDNPAGLVSGAAPDGQLFLVFQGWTDAYEFTVEDVALPDVAVTGLAVDRPPVVPLLPGAALSTTVDVTIENVGALASGPSRLVVFTYPVAGGTVSTLCEQDVELAVGQSSMVHCTDALDVRTGDWRFVAVLRAAGGDRDHANDAAFVVFSYGPVLP